MNDKKPLIIVTGCSGRLGKYIASRLSDEYTLIGLDIIEPDKTAGYDDFFVTDLSKDKSVRTAFENIEKLYGSEFASVIHLAAYYSFSKQDWEKYKAITIDGTKRLLKILKDFSVGQLLFSSTMLVYAPCGLGGFIREDSALDPEWEYPASKVKTEAALFENHGDIPIVIARIAGCYDDGCHSIPLAHQIQRIYENQFKKNLFSGNIHHGSPYLHMEDFAEAVYLLVKNRKELPKELVLNIGEPKTYSYDALQRELGKLILGKELKTRSIPKWLAKMGAWLQLHIPFIAKPFIKPWMVEISDDHYQLDISLIQGLVKWQPERDVLKTFPKMVEALKEDPKKWYREHDLE